MKLDLPRSRYTRRPFHGLLHESTSVYFNAANRALAQLRIYFASSFQEKPNSQIELTNYKSELFLPVNAELYLIMSDRIPIIGSLWAKTMLESNAENYSATMVLETCDIIGHQSQAPGMTWDTVSAQLVAQNQGPTPKEAFIRKTVASTRAGQVNAPAVVPFTNMAIRDTNTLIPAAPLPVPPGPPAWYVAFDNRSSTVFAALRNTQRARATIQTNLDRIDANLATQNPPLNVQGSTLTNRQKGIQMTLIRQCLNNRLLNVRGLTHLHRFWIVHRIMIEIHDNYGIPQNYWNPPAGEPMFPPGVMQLPFWRDNIAIYP